MGGDSACAVTSGGAVSCWGEIAHGPVPVQVSGLGSGVTSVSVGGDSACAVTSGGAVLCWDGMNSSPVPAPLPEPTSSVTSVSVGAPLCVVTAGGAILCWGPDNYNFASTDPGAEGLAGPAASVAVGSDFVCAIAGSSVECVGTNSDGQLGNGSSTHSSPLGEVGDFSAGDVASISAGADFACALTKEGHVLCWGLNEEGQLGNESIAITRCGPVSVPCALGPVPVIGL